MSNRLRGRGWWPVVLVAAAVLTACTEADSQAKGTGQPPETQPPPIPETGADRAIDPCRLLEGPALAPFEASAPSPGGLHSCHVWLVRPDNGEHDHLTLDVGHPFGAADRWDGEPLDVGGRTAYRTLSLRNADEGAWCRLDFPLSATRSVRVDLDTTATDPVLGCAVINAVAPQIAAGLVDPASVGWREPDALGRWDVCDLLDRALGRDVRPDPRFSADDCVGDDAGVFFSVRQSPTENPWLRDGPRVPLSFGTGVIDYLGSTCYLAWAQTPVPNPSPLNDTLVGQVRGAGCDELDDIAEKLHAALADPPPPLPPAPPRIGFVPGEPDQVIAPQCAHSSTQEYEVCRPSVPVQVPDSLDGIMAVSGPRVGDVACAILEPVMTEIFGADIVVMVINDNRCKAVTLDHTVELLFTFYALDPPSAYCRVTEATRLTVAGQPAVSCDDIPGMSLDIFTAVHGDFDTPGNFQFDIHISAPRGREDLDYRDPAAVARLVDLAGTIIQRHVH